MVLLLVFLCGGETMENYEQHPDGENDSIGALQTITLHLPAVLCRAFHRGVWMVIHESGCSQTELMEEMVTDFLKKHGC